MPVTPDRFPGSREEDELKLEPSSGDPTTVGAVRLVSGRYRFYDDLGVFDPREVGTGITEAAHKILRQLIHFIDDGPAEGFTTGAYKETLPAGNPFPTQEIWWESAAKLKKIIQLDVTRNANQTPATEEWKVYDTDGSTILATVTDTIAYSGIIETTRTRAIA